MITGLNHVQVMVPPGGLDAARRFYIDVLGLREIDRPTGPEWQMQGVWLVAGNQMLHLGVEDLGIDHHRSAAHVAYQVDDLPEMRRRLESAGYDLDLLPPRMPGHDRFQTRDPFGNQVEFIQPIES